MPDLPWWVWAGLGVALVVIVGATWLLTREARTPEATLMRRRLLRRPHRDSFRHTQAAPAVKRLAVVVNPTKLADAAPARTLVAELCREHGWGEPIWLETTIEQPGTAQAQQAVADGADVVCAMGGDGTVRNVANGLVGTGIPLAILPAGTGNLLARNLDIPYLSLEPALRVALTGRHTEVDVAVMSLWRESLQQEPEQERFLVMAGIGADSDVMADADERLKQHLGPGAYVVSGLRNMYGAQFKARISIDGALPMSRRSRSVLIGNCGRLFGGLALMPDARVDDGILDVAVLSPKGIVGWAAVGASVATRHRRGHPLLERHAGRRVRVLADRPEQVQVDGDLLGPAVAVEVTTLPKALVVRVPA